MARGGAGQEEKWGSEASPGSSVTIQKNQVGMYPCFLKPRLKYELSWLRWFKAVFSWPSLPTLYRGVEDIPGGAGGGLLSGIAFARELV